MIIKDNPSAIVFDTTAFLIYKDYCEDLESAIRIAILPQYMVTCPSSPLEDITTQHFKYFESQVKKPAKYFESSYSSHRTGRLSAYHAVKLARTNITLAGYHFFV